MPFGRRPARATGGRELQAFRALLAAGGAVATAAGFHSAVAGVRSVPGVPRDHRPEPELDSEIRYYGAFYCAYGLSLLNEAKQPEPDPEAIRTLAATLFGAGLARATGWAAHGPPHPTQRALLVIELVAPAVLNAWQARLRGI